MAAAAPTFSESWYRIEAARVALRSHVQVRRQTFRRERFHVLHDPLNNHFFRLRPEAWAFVARLRLDRTVGDAWRECLEAQPEEAPGQEQALQLLAQLHAGNLLQTELSPDSAKMFERQRITRQREARATWLNVMFARIPLLDPDRVLRRCAPVLRAVWSPAGALLWLGVVAAALKVLFDHAGELRDPAQALLAPSNLPLLYAAMLGVKLLHELGHASACRRFGGEVHAMGAMLMVFMPMPYVDTTSSWGFRSRWARALVGAAGMIVELFLAALAVFVWAATGPGAVHSLAYNVIFVASVTTLLFNANPLLRFDGYYILSDLAEIPNLQGRAQRQLAYLVERRLFGVKAARPPGGSARESVWLTAYGIGSFAYRLLLTSGVLFFLSGHYLLLGLVAFVVCGCTWIVLPVVKGVQYLATSPRLARQRPRALAVSLGAVAAAAVVLGLVPVPNQFRAPGVLEAESHSAVSTQVAGNVRAISALSGSAVVKDQPLLILENRELELELLAGRAELDEAQALRGLAAREGAADLEPIDSRIAAVVKRLSRLHESEAALTVRAPQNGIWVAPGLQDLPASWLARGAELGEIFDPRSFQFSAVVSQEEASRLFGREIRSAQVRLWGQAENVLAVGAQKIIPAERQELPSAALGWRGGGEIALAAKDATGTLARERFFEVRARVDQPPGVELRHGLSGQIRFELTREPLLSQWLRKLGQLLQRRGLPV